MEKIETVVRGVHGNGVVTDAGKFGANCIVDCTGWRAILASSLIKGFVNKKQLFFGLETVVPFRDDRLHFFIDPRIIEHGAAWIFPIGKATRIGIGSHAGKTNLYPELEEFVGNLGLKVGPIHGGYIPYGLRNSVVKNIFLVGDSAGQALPLSMEGIRKSVVLGKECGKIIQKVIDKKISLAQGLMQYRDFVAKSRWYYNLLVFLQSKLNDAIQNKPDKTIEIIIRIINYGTLPKFLQKKYLNI